VPMWCVAPLEMNEGNSLGGKGTIGLQAAVPKRPHTRPLTLAVPLRCLDHDRNLKMTGLTVVEWVCLSEGVFRRFGAICYHNHDGQIASSWLIQVEASSETSVHFCQTTRRQFPVN